ncbi:transposase [Actinomycetospora sp. NBRC 106375]|uniref:IS3 family transposase n=1 Tax=Actinomycetospora sp. NBRC 106375 TaxID=3032207 RepID=UPI00249FFDC2|nr:IS3 family transposase [Actinomycetospora sp. NBRC 106375]GLZ50359.1 transposase [Actinomycetospora sp. NBRC 106375]
MKYAAIANWADSDDPDDAFPVAFMCVQLDVSRSGYYDWRRRLPSRRELCDAELADRIGELHRDLPGQPGVRRVFAELAAHGWRVGRKRVWRLMRAQGRQGRTPWRWRRTTIAGRRPIDAPDLLAQDLDVEATDTRWCGDITYIDTVDGFCFLATVIDLASRRVVGWALDQHLRTDLVTDALTQALATRRPEPGLIFHSDRGTQFTSHKFAHFCADHGIRRSMGRRATCFDNAVAESFFATYKKELIHTRPWNGLAELRQATFVWIEGDYNRRWRHSALGYLTPSEYELGYRSLTEIADPAA